MEDEYIVGRRLNNLLKHWEDVDLEEYKTEKPIILILGGSGTNTRQVANGYAKIIESWLGVFKGDAEILSVSYGQNELPIEKTDQLCKDLIDSLFQPLLLKNRQKLDVLQACKNMRKINVFAHCYGFYSIFNHLIHCLEKRLIGFDYTKEEVDQIISQIFVVSYGSPDILEKRVKRLSLLSIMDETFPLNARELCSKFVENLDSMVMSEGDRASFKRLTANQVYNFLCRNSRRCYVLPEHNVLRLISSNFSIDLGSDHVIAQLQKKKDWSRGANSSRTGECVATCIAAALCNSIANAISNKCSNNLIEFNLDDLRWQLEQICKMLNRTKTNIEKEITYTELN